MSTKKKSKKLPGLAEMQQHATVKEQDERARDARARTEVDERAAAAEALVKKGDLTPIMEEIERKLAAAVAVRSRDKRRRVEIHISNDEKFGRALLGPRYYSIGSGGNNDSRDQATSIALAERHAVGRALAKALRPLLGEGFTLQSCAMIRKDDYDIDQGFSHDENFEIVINY